MSALDFVQFLKPHVKAWVSEVLEERISNPAPEAKPTAPQPEEEEDFIVARGPRDPDVQVIVVLFLTLPFLWKAIKDLH